MEKKWLTASKYKKLTVEERLEILRELELNTPAVIGWLVQSHRDAVERDANLDFPWIKDVLKDWSNLANDLDQINKKYFENYDRVAEELRKK